MGIVAVLLLSAPAAWASRRLARVLTGADLGLAWWMAGVVSAGAAALATPDRPIAASLGLAWVLLTLAVIDVLTLRLPDALTLPLAAVGFVVAVLTGEDLTPHAAAALGAFLALAGLDAAYLRLRGRHGLGLGDAKLMAAAGAWLGWRPLPSVLLLACAGGLAWVAVRMLRRGSTALNAPLPFGAPICLAIWVAWMTHLQAAPTKA